VKPNLIREATVVRPTGDSDLVTVMPGLWAPATVQMGRPSLWQRLCRRARARWPDIRRTLPRDLAIVLMIFVVTRHAALAWVMTDSVHKSFVLVLKGTPARPGELAAFAYSGAQIPGYYSGMWWWDAAAKVGVTPPAAGPAKGTGFVKYMVGVPGDRIEVEGLQVWLVTPRGRINGGLCKPATRHGVPLKPITSQVIPPGFAYMWSPHPDALDSRYSEVGLVPAKAIVGRVVSLW